MKDKSRLSILAASERHENGLLAQTDIPMTGLSAYIANLAQQHGVAYVESDSSALAEVITRLAGDDVKPDETENLIVALHLANVINGQIMVTLLGRYLDETRNEGNKP